MKAYDAKKPRKCALEANIKIAPCQVFSGQHIKSAKVVISYDHGDFEFDLSEIAFSFEPEL